MNTLMMQMRHTAHELRVTLDHVLHGGEAAVAQQNPNESVSFLTEPEVQMGEVHHISEVSAPMTCKFCSFINIENEDGWLSSFTFCYHQRTVFVLLYQDVY